MLNYKNSFRYFTPSYYCTPRNIPAFQGWIEPLNLTATQIDEGVKKISTDTSEDLEDETSINGKKTQRNARERPGTIYKL